MTTPDSILLDLSSGPATAISIGERLRVPFLTIDSMLRRHASAGLVEPAEPRGGLAVWKLTPAGREQCPAPQAQQFPKNRNRRP